MRYILTCRFLFLLILFLITTASYAGNHTFSLLRRDSIAKPLIVIDGKPCNYDTLRHIPPSIVRSFYILKEEEALDIYGKKGKNGVVEIFLIPKRKRKKALRKWTKEHKTTENKYPSKWNKNLF